MNLLMPPSYKPERFTEHNGVLIAEMSDLPNGLGPVWSDSADEGLTLLRPHAETVVYAVYSVHRREGEILWWELRPVAGTNVKTAKLIRVYND